MEGRRPERTAEQLEKLFSIDPCIRLNPMTVIATEQHKDIKASTKIRVKTWVLMSKFFKMLARFKLLTVRASVPRMTTAPR